MFSYSSINNTVICFILVHSFLLECFKQGDVLCVNFSGKAAIHTDVVRRLRITFTYPGLEHRKVGVII